MTDSIKILKDSKRNILIFLESGNFDLGNLTDNHLHGGLCNYLNRNYLMSETILIKTIIRFFVKEKGNRCFYYDLPVEFIGNDELVRHALLKRIELIDKIINHLTINN